MKTTTNPKLNREKYIAESELLIKLRESVLDYAAKVRDYQERMPIDGFQAYGPVYRALLDLEDAVISALGDGHDYGGYTNVLKIRKAGLSNAA